MASTGPGSLHKYYGSEVGVLVRLLTVGDDVSHSILPSLRTFHPVALPCPFFI